MPLRGLSDRPPAYCLGPPPSPCHCIDVYRCLRDLPGSLTLGRPSQSLLLLFTLPRLCSRPAPAADPAPARLLLCCLAVANTPPPSMHVRSRSHQYQSLAPSLSRAAVSVLQCLFPAPTRHATNGDRPSPCQTACGAAQHACRVPPAAGAQPSAASLPLPPLFWVHFVTRPRPRLASVSCCWFGRPSAGFSCAASMGCMRWRAGLHGRLWVQCTRNGGCHPFGHRLSFGFDTLFGMSR